MRICTAVHFLLAEVKLGRRLSFDRHVDGRGYELVASDLEFDTPSATWANRVLISCNVILVIVVISCIAILVRVLICYIIILVRVFILLYGNCSLSPYLLRVILV